MSIPRYIRSLKKEQKKSYSDFWQQSLFIGAWGTQKAYDLGQHKVYVVRVHLDATKIAIKTAFKNIFNIEPICVNTVTLPGKHKTIKKRTKNGHKQIDRFTGKIKKAMIKLPKDAKFEFAQA